MWGLARTSPHILTLNRVAGIPLLVGCIQLIQLKNWDF